MCSKLETDEDLYVRRIDGYCYVAYPQGHNHVVSGTRTWYEARNKCLLLNGDLAIISVTRASSDLVDLLETDQKYWIGLQRDPLMKPQPGKFDHFIATAHT